MVGCHLLWRFWSYFLTRRYFVLGLLCPGRYCVGGGVVFGAVLYLGRYCVGGGIVSERAIV